MISFFLFDFKVKKKKAIKNILKSKFETNEIFLFFSDSIDKKNLLSYNYVGIS